MDGDREAWGSSATLAVHGDLIWLQKVLRPLHSCPFPSPKFHTPVMKHGVGDDPGPDLLLEVAAGLGARWMQL